MRINKRNNKNLMISSEGSSLAIALLFFMLCSLICAGILSLANSSLGSVAKNYDADTIVPYDAPLVPDPVEPVPTLDPSYKNESAAVEAVYNILNSDLTNIYNTVESGGVESIHKLPTNITYEIFSYINFYSYNSTLPSNQQTQKLTPTTDPEHPEYGDIIVRDFTITLTGANAKPSVKIIVTLTNTEGSIGNAVTYAGCYQFKTLLITIESTNPACWYKRYITLTFSDKCYFKCFGDGNNKYHFEYKNQSFS